MSSGTALQMQLIDEDAALGLRELAQLCGLDSPCLIELVEAEVLWPIHPGDDPLQWRFDGQQLSRARRASRLQRDFEASQAALTLMLQLLDEVELLRRQLRQPHWPD